MKNVKNDTNAVISKEHIFKKNPRKISDGELNRLKEHLEELGDLSGIIYCRNNKNYVGGNQRAAIMHGAKITIAETFDKPTDRRTCAHGFVEYNGERYAYREVDFTREQFLKACIVANNDGGVFDFDMLEEWEAGADELKEWGLDLPDVFDLPIVSTDSGSKANFNNKYQINATVMFSVNSYTFKVEATTEEQVYLGHFKNCNS